MLTGMMMALALVGQDPAAVCEEDWRSQACADTLHSAHLSQVGLPSIQVEAAVGAEVYRVAIRKDVASQPYMPVVSFERRAGQPPKVVVARGPSLRIEGPVTAATWALITRESATADRSFEARPLPEGAICLHPWTVTVEMANSRPDFSRVPVRKRTADSCDEDPTVHFGFLAVREAVTSLPACAALAEGSWSNDFWVLSLCSTLGGDTLAAASALNAANLTPDENGEAGWRSWMNEREGARIDWAGEVFGRSARVPANSSNPVDRRDAATFVFGKLSRTPNYYVMPTSAVGLDAEDVIIEGILSVSSGTEETEARYRQVWSAEDGYGWRLLDWTVAPFEPTP